MQLLQIFRVQLSNAESSDGPQRFSLRRGLDGAWIEVSVTSTDGVWSAKLDSR